MSTQDIKNSTHAIFNALFVSLFSLCALFHLYFSKWFLLDEEDLFVLGGGHGRAGSSLGFWGSTRTAGGAGSSLTSAMLSLQI